MQVLSLSELPLTEGEPGTQFNIPGWLKERDALLATVESLKGLISQMQTHRETQVHEDSSQNTASCRSELNQSEISQFKQQDLNVRLCFFSVLVSLSVHL